MKKVFVTFMFLVCTGAAVCSGTVNDVREPGGRRSISYDKPMIMLQLNNSFRFKHGWLLSADYQFNSAVSKYKGTGAGESVKNRL